VYFVIFILWNAYLIGQNKAKSIHIKNIIKKQAENQKKINLLFSWRNYVKINFCGGGKKYF